MPPVYVLQPVNTLLPNFLVRTDRRQAEKDADVAKWNQISNLLETSIHKAAISACGKGRLSKERKHFYTMSVTEHEVQTGIFGSDAPQRHCLVFVREMHGLGKDVYSDAMATRYKDTVVVDGQ
ncbi:uncharacterized protein LOC106014124, partial [Aplysia californica]|uniref:Uncharacterized protein LOC106014124 n=1 Tax=Aplysia californica TaxID=6500 RepID=A0ABM1AFG8_APLCA